MIDLHYRTLTNVADAIANGSLTSTEVTTAMLARVRQLEPRLNAYYSVLEEEALAQAAACDSGPASGPLHGVPIAVKDLCHLAGSETTGGHSFRRGMKSTTDATVVAKLKAAGAVILGKLATTEGAMTGYHRDFNVPRNPWGDGDRWPGVSSGGSGVATAAGLCFGSLGTDTGGSIRWPSAVNGIVGLKPTWGRVSRHGVLDLAPTLDHVGPMTRSVKDAARMLSVIAGEDAADPTSLTAPVPDYESDLPAGVEGLTIGWDEAYATEGVAPAVADAVQSAVKQLAALGAEIRETTIPRLTEEEDNIWLTLAASEAAAVHRDTYPARAADYGEFFGQFLAIGNATPAGDVAAAVIARANAVGRLARAFTDVDLLVMPTTAHPAFNYSPDDAYTGIELETGNFSGFKMAWIGASNRFVSLWDFNGYPTLSVPAGLSEDGLPVSVQFVGTPLTEGTLLRVGHAYEQANDFHNLHPIV